MKKQFLFALFTLLGLVFPVVAHAQYPQGFELLCPAGAAGAAFPLPNGVTFNPTTNMSRAFLCADANGNVTSPVFSAAGGTVVNSFNTRTGAVLPAIGDYTFAQLFGVLSTSQVPIGGSATAFLNGAGTYTTPSGTVSSVFGRTGAVIAASNDYGFSQLSGNVGVTQNYNGGFASQFLNGAGNYTAVPIASVTGGAPLASPGLTGSPTAPTQTVSDNSTLIATDAWVQNLLSGGTLANPFGITDSTGTNLTSSASSPQLSLLTSSSAGLQVASGTTSLNSSNGGNVSVSASTGNGLSITGGSWSLATSSLTGPAAAFSGTGTIVRTASPTMTGTVTVPKTTTTTNCSSSASPAVCTSAAAGSVALPTGTNPTLTVNTTAVTSNSQIFLNVDEGLGTKLSVTCNTTLSTLTNPVVTARVNGTSFTFTIGAVIASNPACVSYFIVN